MDRRTFLFDLSNSVIPKDPSRALICWLTAGWVRNSSFAAYNTDFVKVQDIERNGELGEVIGTYCNTNKPPSILSSSWNKLLVQFNSDSEYARSGFMAKYESVVYRTAEGIQWQEDHLGK